MRTPLQVLEGRLIRGDHAGTGARLDGHVANGHALVHAQLANRFATVFDDVALAAAGADLRDDGEDDVLGAHALGQFALNVHGHGLERLERQRLRGHHVFDLGGADAEREGTERAMRGSVGIAAHDGHARLSEAQNRGESVHDALVGITERVQTDAEFLAVLLQRAQLKRGSLVGVRTVDVDGRRVVVFRRNQQIRVTRLATRETKPFERLRAGDLMHQHQVDVDQIRRAVFALPYEMVSPYLFGQCGSHAVSFGGISTFSP